MNRFLKLQYSLLDVIAAQEDSPERDEALAWETVHMASCGRTAWLLALERGVDPELPACAAVVHDYGRIITGVQKDHANAGFLPVQDFLKSTGLFTPSEIAKIAAAVKNHSSKKITGSDIDEIVKDADVIDCYQLGLPFDRPEKELRYNKWLSSHK